MLSAQNVKRGTKSERGTRITRIILLMLVRDVGLSDFGWLILWVEQCATY